MATGYFKTFRPEDASQTPFVAHKQWTISETALDTTVSADTGSVVTGSSYHLASYSTASLNGFFSGSTSEPVSNTRYRFTIHSNIDQMFYRYSMKGMSNDGNKWPHQLYDLNLQHRDLHHNAHVISIPQAFWGENIHPGSVNILDKSGTAIRLKDDGYTNLYDPSIATGSMVGDQNLVLHIPFSEGYKHRAPGNTRISNFGRKKNQKPGLNYHGPFPHCVSARGIKFTDEGMHGYALNTQGISGSYVIAERQGNVATEMGANQDFAIAMWLKMPTSQSVSQSREGGWEDWQQWDLGPDAAGTKYNIQRRKFRTHGENVILSKKKHGWNTSYPFEISIGNDLVHPTRGGNDGKIIFRRSDGVTVKTLTSSAQYNDNTWRHFIFQKTGSNLEMYCDGLRIATKGDYPKNHANSVTSTAPISIGAARLATGYDHSLSRLSSDVQMTMFAGAGSWAVGDDGTNRRSHYRPTKMESAYTVVYDYENETMIRPFTGSIDELRIYNQAIHSSSIAVLSSSITNTNIVGNIFYDYGLATVTDPRPRYRNMFTDLDKFYVAFQGSHTIFENEYLCHIRSGEFELSMNPTLRENNSEHEVLLKGIASSSVFSPYITTVGLYNNNFDLVAVAKLSSPLRKPKNMDTTIVVRFDV